MKLKEDFTKKTKFGYQCYHETIDEDGVRRYKYLTDKDKITIQRLETKSYNRKTLNLINQSLRNIKKYEKLPCYKLEDIYNSFDEDFRRYINPIVEQFERKFERWIKTTYNTIDNFGGEAEIFTSLGEKVRSKSEKNISEMLISKGIKYKLRCDKRVSGVVQYHWE